MSLPFLGSSSRLSSRLSLLGQHTISTKLLKLQRPLDVEKRLPARTSAILIGHLGSSTHTPWLPSSMGQGLPSESEPFSFKREFWRFLFSELADGRTYVAGELLRSTPSSASFYIVRSFFAELLAFCSNLHLGFCGCTLGVR